MRKINLFQKSPTRRFQRGFSLVELMVAIAIIAILATVMLRGFSAWSIVHKIESDTDALFSFLQDQRLRAFSSKHAMTIVINDTNVTSRDVVTLEQQTLVTNTNWAITGLGSISNRGIVVGGNIRYNGAATVAPSYNCVVSSGPRIRRALKNGATCDVK